MEAKLVIIQDRLYDLLVPGDSGSPTRYNLPMRFTAAVPLLILYSAALAQSTTKLSTPPEPKCGDRSHHAQPQPRHHRCRPSTLGWNNSTCSCLGRQRKSGSLHVAAVGRLTGTVSCDGQQCLATPPVGDEHRRHDNPSWRRNSWGRNQRSESPGRRCSDRSRTGRRNQCPFDRPAELRCAR